MHRVVLAFPFLLLAACNLLGEEIAKVTFKRDNIVRTVVGEVLVEAQSGGVMLLADDGRVWTIEADQLQKREAVEPEFSPAEADELALRLRKELGDNFGIFQTQHYLIAFNSSEAHVKQVGALFEGLYRGFFTFWKNQRWKLPEPRFPLVAIVLRDRQSYLQYANDEIGETAETMIGYYNLASNRMTTYRVANLERNFATIIHEATHQLAYNCGLQKRFADNPMWVSEGLATFFETPDLRNPTKWRSIGRVNQTNLVRWRNYQRSRPTDSLTTLLSDDMRFRNASTATAAYAECWALTYFLIKTRRTEYVNYLRRLSSGQPLAVRSKRERIEMFEEAFGDDLATIDRAFVKYMRRL